MTCTVNFIFRRFYLLSLYFYLNNASPEPVTPNLLFFKEVGQVGHMGWVHLGRGTRVGWGKVARWDGEGGWDGRTGEGLGRESGRGVGTGWWRVWDGEQKARNTFLKTSRMSLQSQCHDYYHH